MIPSYRSENILPIIRFFRYAEVMTLSDESIGCEVRGKKGGSEKETEIPDARNVLLIHHSCMTQMLFPQARHANAR